jgi:hypothetical protein
VHNSTLGGYFEILAETNGRLNHASDAKLSSQQYTLVTFSKCKSVGGLARSITAHHVMLESKFFNLSGKT